MTLIFHALSGSSEASPIPKANREAAELKSCLSASQQLLKAANNRWMQLQRDVSLAFNCTYEDMDIEDIMAEKAHTITGCLANTSLMDGRCGERSGHTFEKDICFLAIYQDLKAYKEDLKHQGHLSEAINDLIKALNFPEDRRTSIPSSPAKSRTFSEDLRECRLLLALQLRTVTINRIMNHLKATKN
ncbi:interleukin-12 subunit alpha [Lissotriton helveticus]